MTNYAQMSAERFAEVLNGCKTTQDVIAIQGDLAKETESFPPLPRTRTLSELRYQKMISDNRLRHMENLADMAVERFIALAQQHKY